MTLPRTFQDSDDSPTTVPTEELVDPAAAWSWTMTQRRELLRLPFADIVVKHVGYRNGPRVDPARLVLTWALDPFQTSS